MKLYSDITRQGWFQGKGPSGATFHAYLPCVVISKACLLRHLRCQSGTLKPKLDHCRPDCDDGPKLCLSHKNRPQHCVRRHRVTPPTISLQQFPIFASCVGMLHNRTFLFLQCGKCAGHSLNSSVRVYFLA